MYCEKCGKEIKDASTYCPFCGEQCADIDIVPQSDTASNKYQKLFVDSTEKYIASLGDSYLNSFLASRKIECCISILSSKRLYLYGTMYDNDGTGISRQRVEKVVDIEDVTGTGFIYQEPSLWKLIVGILLICLLITAVIGIPLIISYLNERQSLFYIEYAGGSIEFDVSIYEIAESQDFHKQIRRAHDNIKDKNK